MVTKQSSKPLSQPECPLLYPVACDGSDERCLGYCKVVVSHCARLVGWCNNHELYIDPVVVDRGFGLRRFMPGQRVYQLETTCLLDEAVYVEPEGTPGTEDYEPGWWSDTPCDYSLRWMFICPLPGHCEENGFFEADALAEHLRGEN